MRNEPVLNFCVDRVCKLPSVDEANETNKKKKSRQRIKTVVESAEMEKV